MLKDPITSMRPKQWYKNLILFVDIVFSMNLLNVPYPFTEHYKTILNLYKIEEEN